jgi:hypothetical protein
VRKEVFAIGAGGAPMPGGVTESVRTPHRIDALLVSEIDKEITQSLSVEGVFHNNGSAKIDRQQNTSQRSYGERRFSAIRRAMTRGSLY